MTTDTPYISYFLILIPFLLLVFIAAAKKKKGSPDSLVYEVVGSVLSPAEISFYKVLQSILTDEAIVLSKMRVADVMLPVTSDKSLWQVSFNKISRKHFDFVICKSTDMSVIAVVELNDKSHNKKNRQDRDEFLQQACDSAALPIVFIQASRTYKPAELVSEMSKNISQEYFR
ncbi:DUF2726 domain-containing protein [Pseudoalteromonas rubra]|uniref:DUF2726 domain-containing protein n=1 Tax=Pseudoalteromonas rubra TaxID=43658 RepID=UPI0006983896|nr:DUF2726 domain-containing protein [Pseudoalteromonas rubra]